MKKKTKKQKYNFTCSSCKNDWTTIKVKSVEMAVNGDLYGKARCPKCKTTRWRKIRKEE